MNAHFAVPLLLRARSFARSKKNKNISQNVCGQTRPGSGSYLGCHEFESCRSHFTFFSFPL